MKWLINKIFETVKSFFQWFHSTEKTRADITVQEVEEARRAAVNTILTSTNNLEDRATLIQSLFRGYKVRSAITVQEVEEARRAAVNTILTPTNHL